MSVFNLYSKQQRALKGQIPSVYRHDDIPKPLRVQIVHIFTAAIGRDNSNDRYYPATEMATQINKILCREYGLMSLVPHQGRTIVGVLTDFILDYATVDQCLDFIRVAFAVIAKRSAQGEIRRPELRVNEAIAELNERFKEHGIGFQFYQGQILPIESEFTHQEITVPALSLLQQPFMAGANQEFLAAHEHHRHARFKECLNECLKAFESTMKAICHKRNWPYNQNDTAKTLIDICMNHNLFPVFMQNHLTGLRMTLESGVPTARNKTSGHGQGVLPVTVSEQFASYVLHLTAANIRFLAACEQGLK
ncbi:MAG: hypothetical protein ABSF95_10610 [Verrucomicrobiota bacterium]|jgi:hypothetical protein